MKIVYILQSVFHQDQHYFGITGNVIERLNSHNAGKSSHISKFRPWKLTLTMQFEDDSKARAFERYLKTGSGKAFARKRFL
jgi:putative endonuclease